MQPGIETLTEKKFIGKRVVMSFSGDKTRELWQSFMPRRKEIHNNIGTELYCLHVYGNDFNFNSFDLHKEFEKWAVVEVADFDTVPHEMETINCQADFMQYLYMLVVPAPDQRLTNTYSGPGCQTHNMR